MATLLKTHHPPRCLSRCDGAEPTSSRIKRRKKNPESTYFENGDDAALAKEMNDLSVKERGQILEEIHGVADEHEESPEFVSTRLQELETCLSDLSPAKRKDLDRAIFLKPSLQKDTKFKLMFLRCELYDATKAAERMARFFALKRNLFGDDKLVKKITLNDLDDKDMEVAQSEVCAVLLSQPDQAGRPILFKDISGSTFDISRNMNRVRFHSVMAILQNKTAQKKGIVAIAFCPENGFNFGRLPTPAEFLHSFRETSDFNNSMPFRISSVHYCYDNPLANFLTDMIRAALGSHIRLRLRTHFGSATETRYALRSFGIVVDGIILSKGEEDVKPKLRIQYLERTRQYEAREEQEAAAEECRTGLIAYPTRNDVLMGRGRPYPKYPGNLKFMELIDAEAEHFKACVHLFERTKALQDVVKKIHDAGGRFLKRVEDGWEIVSEEVAMEKVRKAIHKRPGGRLSGSRSVGSSSRKSDSHG